jgi:hypothetical protein
LTLLCLIHGFFIFVCFPSHCLDKTCNLFRLPKSLIFLTRFKTFISHEYPFLHLHKINLSHSVGRAIYCITNITNDKDTFMCMIKLPGKKRTLGVISNSVLLVRGIIVDLQNGFFFLWFFLYIYIFCSLNFFFFLFGPLTLYTFGIGLGDFFFRPTHRDLIVSRKCFITLLMLNLTK